MKKFCIGIAFTSFTVLASPAADMPTPKAAHDPTVIDAKGAKPVGPGWRTSRGPYPAEALAARAQGVGVVRISTNRDGRVEKAEMIKKIHPLLDAHTVAFARANWTGPPNTTRDVPIIYRIK